MESLLVKAAKAKSHIINQSNKLTEARYSLTIPEQRLVITLLSLISPDDEDFKTYEIKISEFKSLLDIKTHTVYEQVRDTLTKLASRVVHIPNNDGFLICHWFSAARYSKSNGSVIMRFDKELKPYLIQLKEQFTKYRLFIVTQFKSSYTIRIYMLLKQYETIGHREFDIYEFREILGIGEKLYPDFKRFRARVLNQAKKEFEKKNKETGAYQSDITFDLETIRTGRKITRLRFIIKKQAYQEALPLEIPETEIKQESWSQAVQAIVNHGISEAMARQFEEDQGEVDILRCLSLYEEKLKAGKVKNQGGGYLLSMLEAKAGKQTEAEKEAEEQKERKAHQLRQEQIQRRKDELSSEFLRTERKAFLDGLSHDEEAKILGEIIEKYQGDSTVLSMVRRNGLDTMMIASDIVKRIPDFEENREKYIEENLAT